MKSYEIIHAENNTINRFNNYLFLKRKNFNFVDTDKIKIDFLTYLPILKTLTR